MRIFLLFAIFLLPLSAHAEIMVGDSIEYLACNSTAIYKAYVKNSTRQEDPYPRPYSVYNVDYSIEETLKGSEKKNISGFAEAQEYANHGGFLLFVSGDEIKTKRIVLLNHYIPDTVLFRAYDSEPPLQYDLSLVKNQKELIQKVQTAINDCKNEPVKESISRETEPSSDAFSLLYAGSSSYLRLPALKKYRPFASR